SDPIGNEHGVILHNAHDQLQHPTLEQHYAYLREFGHQAPHTFIDLPYQQIEFGDTRTEESQLMNWLNGVNVDADDRGIVGDDKDCGGCTPRWTNLPLITEDPPSPYTYPT
ncbi:hypothetical protein HDU76_011838, partial [Blyttiomyces sp. JEL0837]